MMIVRTAADLEQVSACPMAELCENCSSTEQLNLETVTTKTQGVFCLTLCDECSQWQRLPALSAPRVAVAVLEHCSHLGITADRMDDLLHEEH
jgi:hypothetical protein